MTLSHEILPSALYTMWPKHLQSLKSLCQKLMEEKHLQENSTFDLWPWGQGHKKCFPVPSTSCDLFSYKICSCYVKRFRRRCIYKKIKYLTFDIDLRVKVTQNVAQYPLHHVTFSATKFEVATSYCLGEDTFTRKFNIWPLTLTLGSRSQVTRNIAQYPLRHVSYSAKKIEVSTSKDLGGDAFTRKFNTWPLTLGFKVTWNVAQYLLHHVTFSATKFEVATSNSLGGDTFTRKYIIWPLTLTFGLGSRSHEMLPSTLYIMWLIQLQSLKLLRLTV